MIKSILVGFFLFTAFVFACIAARLVWVFIRKHSGEDLDKVTVNKKDEIVGTFIGSMLFWFLSGFSLISAHLFSK